MSSFSQFIDVFLSNRITPRIPIVEGIADSYRLTAICWAVHETGLKSVTIITVNLQKSGQLSVFILCWETHSPHTLSAVACLFVRYADRHWWRIWILQLTDIFHLLCFDFAVGLVRLRLPQLTMLNIDSTYCLPDIAYRMPGCPQLESVVFRTLRTPPRNEEL